MKCLSRAFLLAVALGAGADAADQPIDFPHNKHVSKGLECVDCHINVETGSAAGLPSTRKCMFCHWSFFNKGPGVQRLLQFARERREVPWNRVYGFAPEAEVRFPHAPHIRAQIECRTCHGEVAKMTVAQPAVRHTMGTCLTCHRSRRATEDCAACHY